ncbi:MAG TPA: cytochrome d ubiquinol oxidase subunit II [Oligoflexus sp.]|uniref:cytochrome d ubiquinol oxidase subunit II n=1 Tax=Oligoflexus sp. TaxID=1971216 RepID=UPI002D417280|nr:cytochrome d ubiquinol oxidase subunit II [Oligoflexus sp.]HYX35265.1 cytochrome d ubiquinol oxidase subunit II [Oligoflexus sp.]
MNLVDVVLVFLGLSLLFYALFGGADLGGGIMELFLSKDTREDERALITHAMAPVWEANHVWLILAVVILFMGFPRVYTEASTYLHLPLMALLVGIVARGCAFTFRYYDTSRTYRRTYTRIFAYSSLWTAFFLGVLGASSVAGLIHPKAMTYGELFLDPWLNPFCISLGLFTASFCTMLAAIFLVGEADDIDLTRILRRKAKITLLVTSFLAPVPLVMAHLMNRPIFEMIRDHRPSLLFFVLAILLIPCVWISLNRSIWTTWARALSVMLVGSIILSWFMAQYPTALFYAGDSGQPSLSFQEAAAPPATLRVLVGGLVVGSLCIFPALAYLFRIFKWETLDEERRYKP